MRDGTHLSASGDDDLAATDSAVDAMTDSPDDPARVANCDVL